MTVTATQAPRTRELPKSRYFDPDIVSGLDTSHDPARLQAEHLQDHVLMRDGAYGPLSLRLAVALPAAVYALFYFLPQLLAQQALLAFSTYLVVLYAARRAWGLHYGTGSKTTSVWSMAAFRKPIPYDLGAAVPVTLVACSFVGTGPLIPTGTIVASIVTYQVVSFVFRRRASQQ